MAAARTFFAHPEQFEHLQRNLLPPLVELARKGHRLRIWSPGCGEGAEPYSIAMTILDVAPEARSLDIHVLATDPDPVALDRARLAQYSAEELRPVPELFKARWAEPGQGGRTSHYRLDAAVRDLVSFRLLPLQGPYELKTYFNAIFCRNILADLTETAQRKAWSSMMPLLAPGGVLYTGNDERITGPALKDLKIAGLSAYLRLAA
jgi:chemotaxis protein methyltransferase CheR